MVVEGSYIKRVFGTAPLHIFQLYSTFFSQMVSASCTLFEEKKGGVMKAPKEVLHKLQFFVELFAGPSPEIGGSYPKCTLGP
jgi:hypothetical protein